MSKKNIINVKSHVTRFLRNTVFKLFTKEKKIPIYEINVYVGSDLHDSIKKGKPFRGNKRTQVKLRRFVQKKKEYFENMKFLSHIFTIKESTSKIFDDCVTFSAERLIDLASKSKHAEDGAILIPSESNHSIIWKIYLRNEEEPSELKKLGSVGCTISNCL